MEKVYDVLGGVFQFAGFAISYKFAAGDKSRAESAIFLLSP